jgi:hypothetical protein
VTDERQPQPNSLRRDRPVSDEDFRAELERETDLSLRNDPERRRYYRAGDLPRSGSPSDDPAAPWHHRGELLTWNGETLMVAKWSQRTGIQVATLLARCRKGWSVERVLTTPPGDADDPDD